MPNDTRSYRSEPIAGALTISCSWDPPTGTISSTIEAQLLKSGSHSPDTKYLWAVPFQVPASIRSRTQLASKKLSPFPYTARASPNPNPVRRLTVAHKKLISHTKRCPTTPRQTRPRLSAGVRGNPSTDGSEIYPHRFYSSPSSCSSASASSSSPPLIPSPLPPPYPKPSTPVLQNI